MSNTIDKDIIITLSAVSNPYPSHPYKFITKNCSLKITIMYLWAPAPKSPAEFPESPDVFPKTLWIRHCP